MDNNNNNNGRYLEYEIDEFLTMLWGEETYSRMKANSAKRAAKKIEEYKAKCAKEYMEMFGTADLTASIEEEAAKEAPKKKLTLKKKKQEEGKKKLPKPQRKQPVAEVEEVNEVVAEVQEAPVEELNFKHIINIDATEFIKKPTVAQKKAMEMKQKEMTIKEIAAAVKKGQCFQPYWLTKSNKFVASGLIAIKVDNVAESQRTYGKVTVSNYLEQALKADIKPVLVYTALNTTKKLDRFVAIYQMDQMIDDLEAYKNEASKLLSNYPYGEIVFPGDMVLGAKELIYVNPNNIMTTNYGELTPEQEAIGLAELEAINRAEEEAILREIEYYDSGQDIKDMEAEKEAMWEEKRKEVEAFHEWWDNASDKHREFEMERIEMRKILQEIHEAEREVKAGIRAAKKAASLQEEIAVTEDEPLRVNTMINRFKAKDKAAANKWIGAIKNNKSENFKTDIVNVTLAELGNEILKGKAIVPAVLNGKLQDANFVEQQLFALDIDYIGVSLEDLKARFKDYPYALIYTSFSHTAAVPKYRLLFVADRVITNADEARFITAALMDIAGCADERCVDVSRIFYAGRSIVEIQEKQFNVDKLLANTSIKKEEVISKATATGEKVAIKAKEEAGTKEVIITAADIIKNLSTIKDFEGQTLEYDGSFNWINSNVNLGIALGKELNTLFRCLKPGHLDRNPSAMVYKYDGKYYYRCSCGDFNKPKSVIDTLSIILDMDKVEVQYLITDALGITMGSAYQRNSRLLIADTKANLLNMIKPDTILYKEMKYLWGTLNVIQDFASAKITVSPLSVNSTRPTFYMGRTQLQSEMLRLGIKGASDVKGKLDQLKDLGFIRPLKDEEITQEALNVTEEHRNNMILSTGKKCINRVEYYELCAITPSMIREAENKITTRKKLGAKKKNMNINRRISTYGLDHTETVNVQGKVVDKLVNNKYQKDIDKMLNVAANLIKEEGYFTEEMLRKAFDPKRKKRKDITEKLINDSIPLIIQELGIEKNRVKNSIRTQYSISEKIKTNTIIFC